MYKISASAPCSAASTMHSLDVPVAGRRMMTMRIPGSGPLLLLHVATPVNLSVQGGDMAMRLFQAIDAVMHGQCIRLNLEDIDMTEQRGSGCEAGAGRSISHAQDRSACVLHAENADAGADARPNA
jgi:hypothetical protein